MFQFTGLPLSRICSSYTGFPIRTSWLLRLCATSPSFSQLITSFFGFYYLGILRMPFISFSLTLFSCNLFYLLFISHCPIFFLLVEISRIELLTSAVQVRRSPSWAISPYLSRVWWAWMDSNHRPLRYQHSALTTWATRPFFFNTKISKQVFLFLLRKEVIHPHLPVRIPCYDFTPIAIHTFSTSPFAVRPVISGANNSRGVTGGVYKTRERIHRDIADSRLLVIPTSWSRVADFNPN